MKYGGYYICADLNSPTCIVAHLKDGRIFVFSRRSEDETNQIYIALSTKVEIEKSRIWNSFIAQERYDCTQTCIIPGYLLQCVYLLHRRDTLYGYH